MKKFRTLIRTNAVICLTLFLFGSALAGNTVVNRRMENLHPRIRHRIPHPIPLICNGPDPAVQVLKVDKSVITRNGHRVGILAIASTLKNIGRKDYISKRGQQSFSIQVKDPSISGPRAIHIVKSEDFPTLRKGASITLRGRYEIPYFIEWGHRTPRYGECRATLIVYGTITYDPDISIDGNPHNDDCNLNNNMKQIPIKFMVGCPW